MNWEATGVIAEGIGVIAVILTLVYLAVHVRYARQATMDQNRLTRSTAVRELVLATVNNDEHRNAQISRLGIADYYDALAEDLEIGTCQPVLDSYFKVNVFFTAPAALSVGKLTWSTLVPRSSGLIGLIATHSGGMGTRGRPRTKRSGC
jgi:hypothetical protein